MFEARDWAHISQRIDSGEYSFGHDDEEKDRAPTPTASIIRMRWELQFDEFRKDCEHVFCSQLDRWDNVRAAFAAAWPNVVDLSALQADEETYRSALHEAVEKLQLHRYVCSNMPGKTLKTDAEIKNLEHQLKDQRKTVAEAKKLITQAEQSADMLAFIRSEIDITRAAFIEAGEGEKVVKSHVPGLRVAYGILEQMIEKISKKTEGDRVVDDAPAVEESAD